VWLCLWMNFGRTLRGDFLPTSMGSSINGVNQSRNRGRIFTFDTHATRRSINVISKDLTPNLAPNLLNLDTERKEKGEKKRGRESFLAHEG